MIPLLIREMVASEKALVLSDWKKDLYEERPGWGRALRFDEWWALVNFVIDNITLPSATVWMACHRNEQSVPLAWLASRGQDLLWRHGTKSVNRDPELAAFLESSLIQHARTIGEPDKFNPFTELKRWPSPHSSA